MSGEHAMTHTVADTRLAKALSHPVRVTALEVLSKGPASPSDIARVCELPVANVSYHMNTLHRLRLIEEVETRHVRGAIEHIYRAVERPVLWTEGWADLPQNVQEDLQRQFFESLAKDVREAVEQGHIASLDDSHLITTRLRLDEQAFGELSEALDAVLEDALGRLQSESAARLADGAAGGREVDGRYIACHFGRPVDA